MNIHEVWTKELFEGISDEKLIVIPFRKNRKISLSCVKYYQKQYPKNPQVFPENPKNSQNHDFIEVAVVGRQKHTIKQFWPQIPSYISQFCFQTIMMC